jgi:Flp pilus assembly protein TadD
VGNTGASSGITPVAAASTNLEDQIQAAVALRVHGDLAKATHALAQLVLVAPDDARVVGEYGKVLVQQGRSDDAVAFLKRAVQIKPGDWTLYSALGVAYDQMDDRKNAKVAYDRALLLHPGDPTVLNNYAVSRMLAKDYDSANRLLMQAQAAGGNLPKIASNLQLLAQLRGANAPALASRKPANTASGSPKSIAAPSASSLGSRATGLNSPDPAVSASTPPGASGKVATTIPAAPKRVISATALPAGAEAKTGPAVVVMQRVPSDTPAPSRRPSGRFAIDKPLMPTEAAASHRTAGAGPKRITPETTLNVPSNPAGLRQPEKNASAAVASARITTSPKPAATNLAAKRATVPAARDHTAKNIVRSAASTQAATRTAPAQGNAPLPALRTADQGE